MSERFKDYRPGKDGNVFAWILVEAQRARVESPSSRTEGVRVVRRAQFLSLFPRRVGDEK